MKQLIDLRKGTIKGSPFVGIFARATNKFVLAPKQAEKKELRGLQDFFGVEILQASVANSSLIGVLAIANKHGVVLPRIAEDSEARHLEQSGVRVKIVKNNNALGNLVALNDSKGVCSRVLPKETVKEIEGFLKVELKQMQIAGSDLAGSALVVNNKGFVVHARAAKDSEELKKFFCFNGKASSANYGDAFVANSIIANDRAALIGLHTTQHEMLRIDEGLSGE